MKLLNKKTGEIVETYLEWCSNSNKPRSLAELNDEWEDYEDELFYIISPDHKEGYDCILKEDYKEIYNTAIELGIGFETEKEAKNAVEKLKAWKRLKDKGFRFEGINMSDGSIKTGLSKGVSLDDCEGFYSYMELLFGGEE